MTGRPCIYCCREFEATALVAEPILPAALGGRVVLKRAACADCSARVRRLTDDFLASEFAPIASARSPRSGASMVASPDDWRRARLAAAKILYCYLLLELGQPALAAPVSETLRQQLNGVEKASWQEGYEVTQPRQSPSPRWHVLMFDSAAPSRGAIGLFGTIWFRFRLDPESLAPHGRLAAFDTARGERGLASLRHRGAWRYRAGGQWGWKG
jgi:hypothetical protein